MTSYWFSKDTPINLACSRIAWYSFMLLFWLPSDASAWCGLDAVLWQPVSFFQLIDAASIPVWTIQIAQAIWKVSLLLCLVGFRTRFATMAAFSLGLLLIGFPHNFGKIFHSDAIAVFILAIMAFSRCGDAISVDAWLRGGSVSPSGEYRWPVRAAWLVTSVILLAAGVAKIRNGGIDWIITDNLRIMLLQHQYYFGGMAWTRMGVLLAQYPAACKVLAAMTVALECGFFLGMFDSRLRLLLVPSALAMLLAFPLLLGPFFAPLIASFVFWIPLDRLVLRQVSAANLGAA